MVSRLSLSGSFLDLLLEGRVTEFASVLKTPEAVEMGVVVFRLGVSICGEQ